MIIYVIVYSNHKFVYYPLFKYDNIKNKFRTGDLIMFSCAVNSGILHDTASFFYKKMNRSNYGHTGMVIKINDILYIVEFCSQDHVGSNYAVHLNESGKGGVRLMKLDDCIREYYEKYNGTFAAKYLSYSLDPNYVLLLLEQYKDYTFRNRSEIAQIGLLSLIYDKENIKYDSTKMVCTEFIHSILNKCGVLKNYPSHLFFPHHIYDKKYNYLQNIKYSDAQLFIYK